LVNIIDNFYYKIQILPAIKKYLLIGTLWKIFLIIKSS